MLIAQGLKNSEEDIALKELTSALMDSTETTLAGTLVSCCATLDQVGVKAHFHSHSKLCFNMDNW